MIDRAKVEIFVSVLHSVIPASSPAPASVVTAVGTPSPTVADQVVAVEASAPSAVILVVGFHPVVEAVGTVHYVVSAGLPPAVFAVSGGVAVLF